MTNWLHIYSVFALGTMVVLFTCSFDTSDNDTCAQVFCRNCRIISFILAVSVIIVQMIIYNIHWS